MTQQEWQALIELLQRVPLNQAERLWLHSLIQRELDKLKNNEEQPS